MLEKKTRRNFRVGSLHGHTDCCHTVQKKKKKKDAFSTRKSISPRTGHDDELDVVRTIIENES